MQKDILARRAVLANELYELVALVDLQLLFKIFIYLFFWFDVTTSVSGAHQELNVTCC